MMYTNVDFKDIKRVPFGFSKSGLQVSLKIRVKREHAEKLYCNIAPWVRNKVAVYNTAKGLTFLAIVGSNADVEHVMKYHNYIKGERLQQEADWLKAGNQLELVDPPKPEPLDIDDLPF